MDEVVANLPFDRLPMCSCDPGNGDPPTRLKKLECRARGGPCSPRHEPKHKEPDSNGVFWDGLDSK